MSCFPFAGIARAVLVSCAVLFIRPAFAADLKRAAPLELCVCGYNMRTQCDGTYLHYISDCFDENNNYCGYDDQISGEQCGGSLPMQRRKMLLPRRGT